MKGDHGNMDSDPHIADLPQNTLANDDDHGMDSDLLLTDLPQDANDDDHHTMDSDSHTDLSQNAKPNDEQKVYRTALSEGSAEVAYCRVMLLGPAGVGKTCLQRGLMKLSFDPNTNSTQLAAITSVRPVSREWMTDRWDQATEDDELEELAQLMHMNAVANTSPRKVINTASEISSISTAMQELMENNIVEKAIKKAVEKRQLASSSSELDCKPLFNLWDCGGQPVFLEVLPIFLTSRTMFLILFDAAKDLHQPWESVYHKEGKHHIQGKVNMSTLQMMERWIALIYMLLKKSKPSGGAVDVGYPRVVPVGTKGDLLDQQRSSEVLQSIDESFQGKAFHHILEKPLIINNKTAGKEKEDPGYQTIRKYISGKALSDLKKKTPISWILFRKMLQLFSKSSSGSNIISFDQIKNIADIAKVQKDHVCSVLKFYHELGVLLYYPRIKGLKKKIILDPKWFVDCIGKVLSPILELSCPSDEISYSDKVEWKLFRENGILVEKLYTSVWSKCKGVEPEEFIELLVHFQLAVQVYTDLHFERNRKQYFVPAVLPFSPPPPAQGMMKKVLSKVLHGRKSIFKAAPLHVTFRVGFVIPGFFTRLACVVLKDNCCPSMTLFFENGIYHNQVTFQVTDSQPCFVNLTEQSNFIEIEFKCFSKKTQNDIHFLCSNLQVLFQASCQEVAKGLQSLHPNITSDTTSFELKVVCKGRTCKKRRKVHYLTSNLKEATPNGFCSNNGYTGSSRSIRFKESCWFGTSKLAKAGEVLPNSINCSYQCPQSDAVSRRPRLLRPEIKDVHKNLKPIACHWDDIGRELGVDFEYREGMRKNDAAQTDNYKLEKVINKWTKSHCSEVSWDTVISVLTELEYNDMVNSVKYWLLHDTEAVRKYGWNPESTRL